MERSTESKERSIIKSMVRMLYSTKIVDKEVSRPKQLQAGWSHATYSDVPRNMPL